MKLISGTELSVSGFPHDFAPLGNLLIKIDVDGVYREQYPAEWQGPGIAALDGNSDVSLMVHPSSHVSCELWNQGEDQTYQKLCYCTIRITEAVYEEAIDCDHKAGTHNWDFELHGSQPSEYELPAGVSEITEGLAGELCRTFESLYEVSKHVSRLHGEQWMQRERFNIAWDFLTFIYRHLQDYGLQSNRATLDEAVKDTVVQLRLGLDAFAARATQYNSSRQASRWYEGLDLVTQSVMQGAALLDRLAKDLASSSSRFRSLFLDRCQQLQDDVIRYRLMFIQNKPIKTAEQEMGSDTLPMLSKLVISSSAYDTVLLSLRGRQAGRALDLLQDEILKAGSGSDTTQIRHHLRTLLVQLAQDSDRIPPSVFLDGVKWNSELISRTKFSDVNSGTYKKERMVIKRIKLPLKISADITQQSKKPFLGPLGWRTLKHENLLPFLGIAIRKPGKDSDGLHLISPRMEYGNVLKVLEKKGKTNEDISRLTHRWILEIAKGMAYLHQEDIVHGDLRARNILIDRNYSVRIADYGLSKLAGDMDFNYLSAHPSLARWMAPELLQCATPKQVPSLQTLASDVYAFACVCLELYTGDVPFGPRVADREVAALVLKGTRPERPQTPWNETAPMAFSLWTIIEHCWSQDPSRRPKSAELVEGITSFMRGSRLRQPFGEDETVSEGYSQEESEEAPTRSASRASSGDETAVQPPSRSASPSPIDTAAPLLSIPESTLIPAIPRDDVEAVAEVKVDLPPALVEDSTKALPEEENKDESYDKLGPPPPYQQIPHVAPRSVDIGIHEIPSPENDISQPHVLREVHDLDSPTVPLVDGADEPSETQVHEKDAHDENKRLDIDDSSTTSLARQDKTENEPHPTAGEGENVTSDLDLSQKDPANAHHLPETDVVGSLPAPENGNDPEPVRHQEEHNLEDLMLQEDTAKVDSPVAELEEKQNELTTFHEATHSQDNSEKEALPSHGRPDNESIRVENEQDVPAITDVSPDNEEKYIDTSDALDRHDREKLHAVSSAHLEESIVIAQPSNGESEYCASSPSPLNGESEQLPSSIPIGHSSDSMEKTSEPVTVPEVRTAEEQSIPMSSTAAKPHERDAQSGGVITNIVPDITHKERPAEETQVIAPQGVPDNAKSPAASPQSQELDQSNPEDDLHTLIVAHDEEPIPAAVRIADEEPVDVAPQPEEDDCLSAPDTVAVEENVPGIVDTAQDERTSVAPPPAHDPAITAQASSDPSHGTKTQPKASPGKTSKVKGATKSTRKERAKGGMEDGDN
ncbi:hypothetical protein PHLCEN_2v4931, partial [Hermanssonia centrifuga]